MRFSIALIVLLITAGCTPPDDDLNAVIRKYSEPPDDVPWELVDDTEQFWADVDVLHKASSSGNREALHTLLTIETFTDGAVAEGMPDLQEVVNLHREEAKQIVMGDARLKSHFAHWFQEPAKPLFASDVINQLKAHDFSLFLGTDKVVFAKDNLGGVLFKIQPGYLEGGTLRASKMGVGIAIFESPQAALSAVEARRKNVAARILEGSEKRSGISDWWFSESQALLSILHHNMVFEVTILDKRYSETEQILWDTAKGFLDKVKPGKPEGR